MMKISNLNKNLEQNKTIELPSATGSSYWVSLKTKTGVVEGKLHQPNKKSNKLIIFEPGFPGDGSTRLEKLWLATLLKHGYIVFTARHNGTIISGKYAKNYLNCPEKQKWAKKNNQRLLGSENRPTMANWIKEPQVALEALIPHFSRIVLAAHSFGPLATMSSLIDFSNKNPAHAKKVKRFVSLAGTFGRVRHPTDPIIKQWEHHLNLNSTKDRLNIGETSANLSVLRSAYQRIHQQAPSIPKHIEFISVGAWGKKQGTTDELVHPIESIDMIVTLGRGYLIIDQAERADEKTDRLAHDMDNLKPEVFQKLVDLKWLPEKQITAIKK